MVEFQPGEAEAAVLRDLARLPEDMRTGGIATVARLCARTIDEGSMLPRDFQGIAQRLHVALAWLQENAPGDIKGDPTDEVRQQREKRLSAG